MKPFGFEKPALDMIGDESVELFHGNGSSLAAGLALPGLGRACVVAIAPALAGTQRHGHAAAGAKANTGKEGWSADDARRGQGRATALEQGLNFFELRRVDDRRDGHLDDLGLGFALAGLPMMGVELVAADIGRPGQNLVKRAKTPASAIARAYVLRIEIVDDGFDAHAAGRSVALPREFENQTHGLGLDRIDLQSLLGLLAALAGVDDAIADRRARSIPIALAGVLLHRAQSVLGVFPGLIFVEQRHDLANHVAHRVVAQFLGDRNEPHAVLGETADIELQLELVAEEAAVAVNDNHVEGRRLRRRRVDHSLKLGTPIIGGGLARLDEVRDHFPAPRLTKALSLPALIRNGKIAVGLPAG